MKDKEIVDAMARALSACSATIGGEFGVYSLAEKIVGALKADGFEVWPAPTGAEIPVDGQGLETWQAIDDARAVEEDAAGHNRAIR